MLPWRLGEPRSPLDRRVEQKGWGGCLGIPLIDSMKGCGQTTYSVLIGEICVTLTVWNANEKSCFRPSQLCSIAAAGLYSEPVGRSEPPSRYGVEYQEQHRGRADRKEERGYQLHVNGKAAYIFCFFASLATGCHGW